MSRLKIGYVGYAFFAVLVVITLGLPLIFGCSTIPDPQVTEVSPHKVVVEVRVGSLRWVSRVDAVKASESVASRECGRYSKRADLIGDQVNLIENLGVWSRVFVFACVVAGSGASAGSDSD